MGRLGRKGPIKRLFTHRRIVLVLLLAWSAAIGGLAWWYDADHADNLTEMARIYARACHEKDVIYRRWNAAHGGVYVAVSKDLQPNPFLQAAERDVTTPSGRTLTLVNPAYMTRQVHELAANADNIHAHITSLKPLNPKNSPDTWEREALLSFENNEKETACVLKQDNKYTSRLMRPLYVEHSCMKCHEQQGYKIGDVRGGISVTVPVDSIWKAQTQHARNVFAALGGIWMLGAATIVLVGKSTNQRRLEREQAEQILRESEERLQAIIQNASEVIYTLSPDGVFTYVSPAWSRKLGHDLSEVVGKSFHSFVHPSDVPICQAFLQETLRTGDPQDKVEFRVRHNDGTWNWYQSSGSCVKDAVGRPICFVGVGEDVTNRKQLEETLRLSQHCIEQAGDCILWIDPDGQIIVANQKACETLEYSQQQLQALTVFDIDATINREWWSSHWEAIRQKESFVIESCHRTASGRVFPVEIGVNYMTCEGREYNCAFARDISERKQTEIQLAHHLAIVNSTQDAIFGLTLDGTITSWNPGAERLYGYTVDEMMGQSVRRLAPPERSGEATRILSRLEQGENVEHFDTIRCRKDGTLVEVSLQFSPIKNSRGEIVGASTTAHEITDRKRAERELIAAKSAAEAANRAKSEFLANMSHEIRTPMTAILGFTDILTGNSVSEEESANAAEIIKRNGVYLLDLINDILDLSKIEAGKCTIDLQPCSPSQIAADVISLMKVPADAKGLPLSIEVQGSIPEEVTTDPIRVRQSLVNLIGNAIKFTEVGSVRVVMRLDSSSERESKLVFDVIDTGIGMSAEQIGLLFQPFSQVDGSACRRFGGTGLGLAISKRMAEMLDGDIIVRSSPGQGSTFSFSIGIGRQSGLTMTQELSRAVTACEQVSDAPQPLNGRILLAEDGPDNQRLIAFLLRKAGAEVELADNGQIALDLALAAERAGSPFDLIVMDMQMPVMDGYEATRKLRSSGYQQPIIALTAHAMTEDRQKCLDAGCDDYMAKPVTRESLLTLVAKHAAVSSGSERPLCLSPTP